MSNPLQSDLSEDLVKLLQARSKSGLSLVILITVFTSLVLFNAEVREVSGFFTWSDQVVIGLVFVWFTGLSVLIWYIMKLKEWTLSNLIDLLAKGYWAGVIITYCLIIFTFLIQSEVLLSPMLKCDFPKGSEDCTSVGIWMFIFAATAPLAVLYKAYTIFSDNVRPTV